MNNFIIALILSIIISYIFILTAIDEIYEFLENRKLEKEWKHEKENYERSFKDVKRN